MKKILNHFFLIIEVMETYYFEMRVVAFLPVPSAKYS